MAQPRLGFNLRLRHFNANAKRIVTKSFKNKPFETIGLITSIVAISFSITANNISKSAFELAKNDTTQTAQIARLNADIIENQKQNTILSKQLETLISLSTDTKNIDSLTYKVLNGTTLQSNLTNKQLVLELKNENAALVNDTIAKESDLFALNLIFDEIYSVENVKAVGQLTFLYKNPNSIPDYGYSTLMRIKSLLGKGLSNKIFQTDSTVKQNWYSFFATVSNATTDINVFNSSANKNVPERRDGVFKHLNIVFSSYLEFINKMLKIFIKKEAEFRTKNKINI